MNLQILWFCLIAVLWGGYLVLEGFDFGVGMLLPFLPRNESERGAMFQSIGPVWDGNEVWLVVAGAATFAAFPAWYATMFSGFYLALLLILFFLIVRVVSFEWRGKGEGTRWRRVWLWANAGGSTGIALIWGIGLSNLLNGVPLDSGGDYTGSFWDLFSGYTVLGGIAFVLVFAFHGASYLTLRTTGELCTRARAAARMLALPAVAVAAAYLIWTVVVAVDRNDTDVFPPLLPAAIAIAAFALAGLLVYLGRSGPAFALSAIGTLSLVATLFTSLYPRVMVSNPDFGNSLTIDNASSAHYTLAVMSVVAAICLPVILLYQGWTYYVFRARISGDEVRPPAGLLGARTDAAGVEEPGSPPAPT
jgi:cytochrome d ubiquinol oxidase subunit II